VILIDSSVWIDFFRGTNTPQTKKLEELLAVEILVIGDLILTEVLQGFNNDKDFNDARRELTRLEVIELGGAEIAIKAAQNFRTLRKLGFTIRKTIDPVIATRCIEDGYALLHNDSDFEPFVKHFGLHVAM
jgi:predicted nucleic acid-binding protein